MKVISTITISALSGLRTRIRTDIDVDQADFCALTQPKSVAVVGASSPEQSWFGGRAFRNVAAGRDSRRVYAVNERRAGSELLGMPVYDSLKSLPEVPDLIYVLTPPSTVPKVLDDAGSVGARAVLLSSAAREDDLKASEKYEVQIVEAIARNSLRLVGGNSLGIVNPHASFTGSFASATDSGVKAGNLAFLSHSGAALSFMMSMYRDSPIGYSLLISTGNENDITLPDMLLNVIEDDNTEAILLFLEGLTDGPLLRRAFLRARVLGKPVAALKVGASDAGQRAMRSHTGRLAGSKEAFRALVCESGVQEVHSYQELFDLGYRFAMVPPSKVSQRRRGAIVTSSGGASVVASDSLSANGWTLPALSEETAAELRQSGASPAANPLDVTGGFQQTDKLARLTEILANSGEVDEIFVISGAGGDVAVEIAANIADRVPLMKIAVSGGYLATVPEVRKELERGGVAFFDDPTRAVVAAARHADAIGTEDDRRLAADLGERLRISEAPQAIGDGRVVKTAGDLFGSMEKSGIACAPWRTIPLGAGHQKVLDVAAELGYPVALKLDATGLLHKSDAGGVILDVPDEAALRAAAAQIDGIVIDGSADGSYLIQPMTRGVEVILGARYDPDLGYLLLLGLGGVLAELYADFETLLLPCDPRQVSAAISRNGRLAQLLGGHRGTPAADRAKFEEAVTRFADWVLQSDLPFSEVEINPLMVNESGCWAVDARAVVSRRQTDQPAIG